MDNPQAVINKKGPIAAQNQHLGRTYVSKLYPVPVRDSIIGGPVGASVSLELQGYLLDVGEVDHLQGGVASVVVGLVEPVERLYDHLSGGGMAAVTVSLRVPIQDVTLPSDSVQSTGVAVLAVTSTVKNVFGHPPDDHLRGGGISVRASLTTN